MREVEKWCVSQTGVSQSVYRRGPVSNVLKQKCKVIKNGKRVDSKKLYISKSSLYLFEMCRIYLILIYILIYLKYA